MTAENSVQKYKVGGGKDGFDCKQCKSEYKKLWRQKHLEAERYKRRVRYAKLKGLPIPEPRVDVEDSMKSDPLAYLKMNPSAAQAETDFGFAVEKSYENGEGLPLCFDNPAPYTDYPENNPPSMVQAALLCISCPVLEQCAKFGEALKPTYGIFGGERYVESSKIGVGEKAYK